MTYEGLARRYRPSTFEDVVGQSHIVKTLSLSIERERWSPAYLFIGDRGLGKTSMARLLTKAINCDKGPTPKPCGTCESCEAIATGRDIDVQEIDAASNTGVDNVREVIIQSVGTAPLRGRVKAFIIDEVHMLSTPAFNALLKTLEEPPPNVLFVLATTEGHKVPATIRSRCQRFDFRPIELSALVDRLKMIAEKEKIQIDDDALHLVAQHAEGGVRDALSALDLVSAFGSGDAIGAPLVEEALGMVSRDVIHEMIDELSARKLSEVLERVNGLIDSGTGVAEILRGLLNGFREILLDSFEEKDTPMTRGRIVKSIERTIETVDHLRYSRHPQLEMEVLIARLGALHDEEIMLQDIHRAIVSGEVRDTVAAMPSRLPSDPPRSSHSSSASSRPSTDRQAGKPSGADSSSSIGEGKPSRASATSGGAGKEDPEGVDLTALAEGISSVAEALLANASLKKKSGTNWELSFEHDFHRERFVKERDFLTKIEKRLAEQVGGTVALSIAGAGPTAKPSRASAESSSRSSDTAASSSKKATSPKKETDPVEEIKRIFDVDVVEVIKK